MAYIGSPVQQVLSRPTSQSFNGDGSTTVFTLNRSVNVSEELEVFVSNVQQEPGVGKSYTANGTSLTFDEAPPSGTGNIYVIYRGLAEVTRVLEHHPNNPLAATTGTFSDSVGIGGAPLGQLDVIGSNSRVRWDLSNTYAYQVATNPAASTYAIAYYDGSEHRWLTNSTTKVTIDNSGNVGINTTTMNAGLNIKQSADNAYQIKLEQINTTDGYGIICDMTDGALAFSRYASSAYEEHMRITDIGRVGIGTPSPNYLMELSGTGGGDTVTLALTNAGAHPARLRLNSGHGNWSVGNSVTVGDALEFRDESANTTNMIITNVGNVGIGNVYPAHPLHIYEDGGYYASIGRGNSSVGGSDPWLGLFNNTDIASATFGWGIYDSNVDGSFQLWNKNNSTTGYNVLTALRGGNVGVGVDNPDTKLTVNGAIKMFGPGEGQMIEYVKAVAGTYSTCTIEVQYPGAGSYMYEVGVAGTAGCAIQVGGGYTNGTVNFSHTGGAQVGTSWSVTSPSNNLVRITRSSGVGVHPTAYIKTRWGLSGGLTSSNISINFS